MVDYKIKEKQMLFKQSEKLRDRTISTLIPMMSGKRIHSLIS